MNWLSKPFKTSSIWMDWANLSGQKYAKIVSEVETKLIGLINYFRTKLKPFGAKKKIKKLVTEYLIMDNCWRLSINKFLQLHQLQILMKIYFNNLWIKIQYGIFIVYQEMNIYVRVRLTNNNLFYIIIIKREWVSKLNLIFFLVF